MYPPPEGQDLTAEQAVELDSTFLASDPFQYFRSRIASLAAWHDAATETEVHPTLSRPGAVGGELNRYIQQPVVDTPFSGLDVRAQVAADALAVRHHAAESLIRLACARLAASDADEVRCLWAAVASGPAQTSDVLARLRATAREPDFGDRLFRALVQPEDRSDLRSDSDIVDACNVYGAWMSHAAMLLSPAEIDLQSAHNKVKHGLAVRARSDLRIMFTPTAPDSNGNLKLSSLTASGAVDIFDQPVLETLGRPKVDGHRQGLEITQLRLKPSALLAEAYMMAMAHGTLFRVASVEHFTDRASLPDHASLPTMPGYPVGGPKPIHIDAQAPRGMRFPLTEPPGGGGISRPAGIGFREYFQVLHLDFTSGQNGQVVDG